AGVKIKAQASSWEQQTHTDDQGHFTIPAVPAGVYTVEITSPGFKTVSQTLTVNIGSAPLLSFTLELASTSSDVQVSGVVDPVNAEASSPPVMVTEQNILRTPGGDRTASMALVTNYVPGSYMLHDHLHMRGGHQVSWLVDGVPVPNTNISTNVGRQIDPKDIETVEIGRGGYNAKFGDRTYGVINVVPRSGFEFGHREAQLSLSYGTFNQSNDQLSFGGHSEKFAYYGSVSGNRSEFGLEPPSLTVLHNAGNGMGGFTSLTYNLTPHDQLRLAASLRRDFYQIPNTPADQAAGVRDTDKERDGFANFSWVHTFNPSVLLTTSPFFHHNNADYEGGANDPLITTSQRSSNYVGGQSTLQVVHGAHNLNAGLYGFYQHDDSFFGLQDSAGLSVNEQERLSGTLSTAFLDDQYKLTSWLTLNGGLRFTHYESGISENAANPRIGASIRIPRLNWVVRGFYGRYYQPPPLTAIGGPLLAFAINQGFDFLPLHGERDEQHEFGLTIPFRGWILDLAHFQTVASNFSDHEVLGNSNITLPLTIQYVRSRGWEAVIRSPQVWKGVHLHTAFSNQVVKGRGGITGGLTDFVAPPVGFFYIDHDQRITVSVGGDVTLPRQSWISANVVGGSGFLDGNGPTHLPKHASLDISLGKSIGESVTVGFSALNVSNARFLLGRESAFAGTHYNDPRQIIGQLRYHFHF
ncbi:MAG TPA: TonB-dependent receptor, partial [Terriglobales bacterium]|nr:TonB-dependent receptor [Terriglobales bacterium]